MERKIKKYIHLVNDITNLLLKKDREKMSDELLKFRHIVIAISIVAALSLVLNLVLLFKIF